MVKSKVWNTLSQTNLEYLMLMNSEKQIFMSFQTDQIIDDLGATSTVLKKSLLILY